MPRGRRVRRVVRKFDTWTVFKVALLFNLCMFVVFLTAGVILFKLAETGGAITLLEKAIRSNLQLQEWRLNSSALFGGAVALGLVSAAMVSFLTVIAALLYNLISDLIGGIQMWVLEEIIEPPVGPVALAEADEAAVYDDADPYQHEFVTTGYAESEPDDETFVEVDGYGPDTKERPQQPALEPASAFPSTSAPTTGADLAPAAFSNGAGDQAEDTAAGPLRVGQNASDTAADLHDGDLNADDTNPVRVSASRWSRR